ncbi:hypothetical protein [uncultured Mucilaginibacter sp.]|uniref:hypothetical protein n=1 Tax=uncultured Mucilaginibacter sp. TaxID=797541 RepID=UPI0025E12E25|nr:hypothetical protein [uncultured Mucilaginibacter sp.]
MFKQFTENIDGDQVYLIASMGIFVVFFIAVAVLLIKLRKKHVDYMSDLPLEDGALNSSNTLTL